MATTLVLGGIRSGKSRFAESLLPAEGPARYLATGSPDTGDPAWTERIAAHRSRRPSQWTTAETTDIATELRTRAPLPTLIDDLGGWLTAAMDAHGAWDVGAGAVSADIGALVEAVADYPVDLVIVSPEVGLTVVPATAAGRLFADALGALNQAVAARADRVLLVVAGQPLTIKGGRS
ncbi:bifunctional adenosylcobinamide kinase/adenosylcobinamide-phosphate guanylyltransferase [Mycobacteroides abscessus]|uniref:Adenosylcobinamide kinase n=2 Tax=Mycobacteroides abscessus TaxID=36809 RepID=A0AB38D559_9MYCO|nr:bifunctional adenosylcobinamide kinase/adenosylcobinamide-phosphate guanylyltransferase [Mycobacteroides abscessus]ETZ88984.1 cobinamide kinase / cobinamide phosphate guanyltransferase family protein [Mycobacteroides abscessus MAB_030201_1075]ETZ94457.1 cobinamide kinase / cobinamide phosphate guanyltransferase family protein [Mycobacteroides abscessus MAB_030201_1061]AMU70137.1 adenosylcobinamide kinase/adenosylcobinamide phosphate guanyltransferase [Mycobacteroides abscessus]EIT97362.1 cob